MRIGAITSPSVGGASPSLVFFDKSSPHGFCENLRSVGEIFPCRMPHSTSPHSHISHTTFHTQHITPNISHSTFSTLLPPIYTVFPVAPCPASKYAILSASLQPAIIQPLIVRMSPFNVPHLAFPTLKRHLSPLDPCPFEAPSLTFRISIPKLS